MESPKTLDSKQRITVAYFHIVRGISQQDLAAMFDVNQGRISEAVAAIRGASKK